MQCKILFNMLNIKETVINQIIKFKNNYLDSYYYYFCVRSINVLAESTGYIFLS